MDVTIVAGLVISGIAALSSIVQAYTAARSEGREIGRAKVRQAQERARRPARGGKSLSHVIDEEILNVMLEDVRGTLARLKKALADPKKSDRQKDREIEAAGRAVCATLKRIKRLNNGQLPTKGLEHLWESHQCK